LLAAGLHGIEHDLPLPLPPETLREAADLFAGSAVARAAFGDDVVEHYGHAARIEVAAFDAAVTDWERRPGFERL
jgi:glutamine synthetase